MSEPSLCPKTARTRVILPLACLLIGSMILGACGAPAPGTASPVASQLPPSPSPTFTPAPSPTPAPKFPFLAGTPLPPASEKITADNASQLVELARLGKPRGFPHTARFAPDGKSIAVATTLGIYFFDAVTLRQISFLPARADPVKFEIAPDSQSLALVLGTDKHVELWKLIDGTLIRALDKQTDPVTCLAFSHDGSLLATGSKAGVNIWQVSDGSLAATVPVQVKDPASLVFAPDGSGLYVGSQHEEIFSYEMMDKSVTAMHRGTTSGKNARTTTDVRVSADGKTLVAVSSAPAYSTTSQGVVFMQAANGKMVLSSTFPVSMRPHYGFDLSLDGQYVAVLGKHKYTDEANVVELSKVGSTTPAVALGNLPSSFVLFTDVSPMFSPDGKTLALLGANGMALWSTADGAAPGIFPLGTGVISDADISPDGKTLVSHEDGSGEKGFLGARLWELADGSSAYQKELSAVDGGVRSVIFSRDGTGLVAGRYDPKASAGKIGFWPLSGAASRELSLGAQSFLEGHASRPMIAIQLAFSPDGKLISARSSWRETRGGLIRVYSASDGKLAGTFVGTSATTGDDFLDLTFSPDAALLAAGLGNLQIVRVEDSAVVQDFKEGTSAAFSPDGKLFAYGLSDKSVQLLSVPDFKTAGTLLDHSDVVSSLAFSPDGGILAAGTKDGQIWLWRVSDSKLLYKVPAHNGIVSQMLFTPDGSRLISVSGNYRGNGDATIRLWGVKP